MHTSTERFIFRTISIIVAVLVYLLFCIYALRGPFSSGEQQIWSGYYTIAVTDSIGFSKALELLKSAGYGHTVSEEDLVYEVSTYRNSSIETFSIVSAEDLYNRFEPQDPRIDPYMAGAVDFFRTSIDGKPGSIIFVKSNENPFLFYFKLKDLFADEVVGDNVYRFVDFNPTERIIFAAFFLLLFLYSFIRWQGNRVFVFFLAFPWSSFLATGEILAFAASSVLFFCWLFLFEAWLPVFDNLLHHGFPRTAKKALILRGVYTFFCLGILVAMAVLSRKMTELQPVLIAGVGGSIALSVCHGLIYSMRKKRRLHRLFIPLPLRRTTFASVWEGKARSIALVLFLVLFLPAIIVKIGVPYKTLPLPAPEVPPGVSGYDWVSLHRLRNLKNGTNLVDITDFLSHRAYQQNLAYGYQYKFPDQNEVVTVSRFVREDGKINKIPEIKMELTEEWITNTLELAKENAFTAFLSSGVVPYGVHVIDYLQTPISGKVLFFCIILSFFCVFPFLVFGFYLTFSVMYGMRSPLMTNDGGNI